MKSTNLIGISGKKNSGKDTCGIIIQYLIHTKGEVNIEYFHTFQSNSAFNKENFSGYKIKKFASKLKQIICLLTGCTIEQLEDEDFKNTELDEEWWCWKLEREGGYNTILKPYHESTGTESYELIKPTYRFLLQNIGTDLLRNQLHPNIWVNSLMSEYIPISDNLLEGEVRRVREKDLIYPNWIITDVRFKNEIEAVKSKGGIVIRVERKGIKLVKEEHSSEKQLDNHKFEHIVTNNGSIEELIEKIKEILIKKEII